MPTSRRHFLQSAAAGLAASALAAQDKTGPNGRVQVATIGLGGMGTGDTHSSTAVPGVELVAVADIYQGRLDHAKDRSPDLAPVIFADQ
jgi:predicted homoserine dehydrogenase-like protein